MINLFCSKNQFCGSGSGSIGINLPYPDPQPVPADKDPNPYPFQTNVKINSTFYVNFDKLSKILKIMTPVTLKRKIKQCIVNLQCCE